MHPASSAEALKEVFHQATVAYGKGSDVAETFQRELEPWLRSLP